MQIAECLYEYLAKHPPDYGDADSILEMLYSRYNECNSLDTEEIKVDFEKLYQQMNGMPLREMDRILDVVCALCKDHQMSGFADGIKVGLLLAKELHE
jgi:hypothetical protein